MRRQSLGPKRYGDIAVGGRAKVRLGDSQITKNYHVDALNLTVSEGLLPHLQDAIANAAKGQRTRLDKRSAGRIAPRMRNNIMGSSKKGALAKRGSGYTRTICEKAVPDEVEDVPPDPEHVLSYAEKLLFKLWRLLLTSPSANSLSQEDALTISQSAEPDRHESQALVKTHSDRAVLVCDYSMMIAFLLSCIIGKHVSAEDVVKFLVSCRQDDLLPLLLLTLCIGAYRYYTMRTICRAPTQQFWMLEDAYGFPRRISMDVLIDYSVFQRFLHVHYRDAKRTTGAALVEANQFHLMLGSRRGVVIGSTNWNVAVNNIKPGRDVINALYITSYDKTCFTCNSNLAVTEFGEFHCTTCNTFHRDYTTFNLQARQRTRREPEPSPSTELTPAITVQSVKETQRSPQVAQEYGPKLVPDVVQEKYDVNGIKNLDIRLLPRPDSVSLFSTLVVDAEAMSAGPDLACFPLHPAMRLLHFDDTGNLIFTHFSGRTIPPYAILSHVWGGDEVLFEDLVYNRYKSKSGYRKIEFCAKQAARSGLRYFWIDTCCIDRWNRHELSEAINSMYRWYRNATKCYVLLSDVSTATDMQEQSTWEISFGTSKWFTRGWTLQELIAPESVEFFSSNGCRLGNKRSLLQLLHKITSIPVKVLQGGSLENFSLPDRMAWAQTRATTEPEDGVYCLLGILNVFMPVSYGEGKQNALRRLQNQLEATNSLMVPFS